LPVHLAESANPPRSRFIARFCTRFRSILPPINPVQ
jgi:hypothetical protein